MPKLKNPSGVVIGVSEWKVDYLIHEKGFTLVEDDNEPMVEDVRVDNPEADEESVDLDEMTKAELVDYAYEIGLTGPTTYNKDGLKQAIIEHEA